MGTLSISKNKRNPQSQSTSSSNGSNHIAKKPKSSSSSKPSRKSSVSRLHLYPDHKAPIRRQIQAPCTIISDFNSTQKRFSQNMRKKSSLVDKGLVNNYNRAKEWAVGTCRHVKFENVEQCDDDIEVIEVDNGNVVEVIVVDEEVEERRVKHKKLNQLTDVIDVDEEVEERRAKHKKLNQLTDVIDVDEEVEEKRAKHKKLNQLSDVMDVGVGSPLHKKLDGSVERYGPSYGSGEVEEIRAKYKKLNQLSDLKDVDVGSPLHKKLDGSVERRGPNLRKLRFEIKLKELRRASCQKPCPVNKEEEEEEDVVHDLFSPLTEEEEEMVANALSYSNRKKVLVNHENSNMMITGEALQCLRPRAWLNDEVINIYLELLKDRERREPKKFLKCHFFNTFFYKKLVGGMTRTGYDYESVKRWTAQKKLGYGLDDCDKIFVPVHKEIHWCLAVINKKDKKFQYLDSLGGTDKKVLRALAKYLTDEVKDKTGKSIDVTSWEQEYATDLPNQENGYDCGMFMIKYIDFYSRDVGLCFSQDDMPYFRKRTAKEILILTAN